MSETAHPSSGSGAATSSTSSELELIEQLKRQLAEPLFAAVSDQFSHLQNTVLSYQNKLQYAELKIRVLEERLRLVRIADGQLEVAMERSAARGLINDLSRKLEQWTGRRWTVIVSNEPGQPTLRSQNEAQKNQRERAAESDPRVQEVLARFPGAKVVEVRKLAPEPPESVASDEDPTDASDGDDQ